MKNKLSVILPKGRLSEKSGKILKDAGLRINIPGGRNLIKENKEFKVIIARASDVPIFVEHGIDIGITGSDIIKENRFDLFIPLVLPFGKCRLSLAVPKEINPDPREMDGWRIATKYPQITLRYFEKLNVTPEIIKLNGSIEVSVKTGIADAIVDIVEKGTTIKANGLKEIAVIEKISALLLVNRISQKVKFQKINNIINRIKEVSFQYG